jgi:lantibiotic modifying enzyme
MAHGAAGVIAFLGITLERQRDCTRAGALLSRVVPWYLEQYHPEFGYGVRVDADEVASSTRSAWCNGNPGCGMALLVAGRGARRPDWERFGREVLTRETGRPLDQCGVMDAGLCHGSSGLAHIYNRAFQSTRAAEYEAAARRWADHALAQRQPGVGLAGYKSWGAEGPLDDASFLSGIAGIGLALLALVTPVAPTWDALLLTSIP